MKIRAEILLTNSAEGGREHPIVANYRPTLRLSSLQHTDCVVTSDQLTSIAPGGSGQVSIRILHPQSIAGIQVGSKFTLTEGVREIGTGTVLEIIDQTFAVGDLVIFNGEEAEVVELSKVFGVLKSKIQFLKSNRLLEVRVDQLEEAITLFSNERIAYQAIAAKVKAEIFNQRLLSPFESNVVPLPHQILALEKVMAGQFLRFLLADEVGMGKTIEAGLVHKELKLKDMAKRTLIIVTKSAMLQWKQEMKSHFNETFHIYDADYINVLTRTFANLDADNEINIWQQNNQIIVSMDTLKPIETRQGWSKERVTEYNRHRIQNVLEADFDLLIIDECHKVGGSTQLVGRFQMADVLCSAIPNVLLLSATPHRGKSDHFRRILQLLDADAFSGEGMPSIPDLEPYVVRTEKRQAIDYNGKPLFNKRNTQKVEVAYDAVKHAKQQQLYASVSEYVVNGFNRARQTKNTSYGFVMLLFQRMMSSSTKAILDAMQKRADRLSGERMDVSKETLIQDFEEFGFEGQYDMDFEQKVFALVQETQANYDTELSILQGLIRSAKDCIATETDAKVDFLLTRLAEVKLKEESPDVKFLIFTEFTSTQWMLKKMLEEKGGYVCEAINGSMEFEERIDVLKKFKEKAQVLISTDAAGESLNMQFAYIVVNYDMPWNPMVVEQRIGRVDRIGQDHQVQAFNILLDNSIDKRVYEVIETKLNQIMLELGIDKTADVLDSTIERDSISKLYLTSLLEPARFEAESKSWLEEIRNKLLNYRSTEGALPTLDSKDIRADKVDAIRHSPIPSWLRGLTRNYLRTRGIPYHSILDGLQFTFPGFKENIYTFDIKGGVNNPIPEPLSLQHEIIKQILDEAIPHTDSQPIPLAKMRDGKSAKGFWSLWHLDVRNRYESHNSIQPLFISDDGDSFVSLAQDLWSKIVQGNESVDCVGSLSPEESQQHYGKIQTRVEELLRPKYSEAEGRIEANTSRLLQNKEKAFSFRERQLRRIGIENIRQSRMLKLTREKELWMRNFDTSKQVVPNLTCLLMVRMLDG